MAENDYVPGSMDVSGQKATYQGVMDFSTRWGLPFSMALTAFFTALLVGSGLLMGFVTFGVVFVAVHVIVKMFFSH